MTGAFATLAIIAVSALGVWLLGSWVMRVGGLLLVVLGVFGLATGSAAGSEGATEGYLLILTIGGVLWLVGHWLFAVKHHLFRSPLAQRIFEQALPERINPVRGWGVPTVQVQPPGLPVDAGDSRHARKLRDELDDAAPVFGRAAECCLEKGYGAAWLAYVNERLEGDGRQPFTLDGVRRDPRKQLSLIGYDPALEPYFGPARAKARFISGVATAVHHNDPVSAERIADAREALGELSRIAVALDPGT